MDSKRVEHELYEDQVPPHAPGVDGNGPGNAADASFQADDAAIAHGVAADAHVIEAAPVGDN